MARLLRTQASLPGRRGCARKSARMVETLECRTLFDGGPIASIDAPDVTAGGGTTCDLVVAYDDADGVAVATVDPGDLAVTGPGGRYMPVLGVQVTPPNSAAHVTARYTLGAPDGTFDAADNGQYAVFLDAGFVRDVLANPCAATTATFTVNVVDDPPVASVVTAADVTAAGAATQSVWVEYRSAHGVDTRTIDPSDLVVTGPAGAASPLVITEAAVVPGSGPVGPGAPVTVRYTVAGPGGLFDVSDNGGYTVTLVAGAVTDLAGNPSPGGGATFNVAVPPDAAPPVATIFAGPGAAGATETTLIVLYTDEQGVDVLTADSSDLTVVGPGGPLAVASAAVRSDSTEGHVVVTYTLAAPGGTWDSADAGRYVVSVAAGAVLDRAGHPVGEATASFDAPILSPDHGPDLRVSLPDTGEQSVLPGQADRVRIRVTNDGEVPLDGPVAVELRTWGAAPDDGVVLAATPARRMRLKPGESRFVSVRFNHLGRTSSYSLVAVVDPANMVKETDEWFNRSEPGRYSVVRDPFTDVEVAAMGGPVGGVIPIGRKIVVPVRVHNRGNVAFRGPLNVDLFGSTGENWADAVYERLAPTAQPRVTILPGRSREVRVRFRILTSLAAGRYTLKAVVNRPPTVANDPNAPANAEFTRSDYYPSAV